MEDAFPSFPPFLVSNFHHECPEMGVLYVSPFCISNPIQSNPKGHTKNRAYNPVQAWLSLPCEYLVILIHACKHACMHLSIPNSLNATFLWI